VLTCPRQTTPRPPEEKKPFLRFGDANLYLKDYRSLDDDEWLSDNVITFWEHHLEERNMSKLPRANIRLMRPAEVMLVANGVNVDESWDYTHVFVPINEGGETGDGGLHWSLVVVSLRDGVAFHYNSSDITQIADRVVRNLEKFTAKPLRFSDIRDVPQQRNTSDCGVYMCLFMEELLVHRLLMKDGSQKVSMSLRQLKVHPKSGRRKIKDVIKREREQALGRGEDLIRKDGHGGWI
jgi:sentrin-specific protease 8